MLSGSAPFTEAVISVAKGCPWNTALRTSTVASLGSQRTSQASNPAVPGPCKAISCLPRSPALRQQASSFLMSGTAKGFLQLLWDRGGRSPESKGAFHPALDSLLSQPGSATKQCPPEGTNEPWLWCAGGGLCSGPASSSSPRHCPKLACTDLLQTNAEDEGDEPKGKPFPPLKPRGNTAEETRSASGLRQAPVGSPRAGLKRSPSGLLTSHA